MHKYKISTEIGSLLKYVSYNEAIELVGKAGFDCFDLTMTDFAGYDWRNVRNFYNDDNDLMKDDYKEKIVEMLEIAKKYNMTCNQAHAPFPSNLLGMEKYLIRSIECAALAGAKNIVVHPINDFNAKQNYEFFKRLEPYAKKFNIRICLENMWTFNIKTFLCDPAACHNPVDFNKHLDLLDSDYFGACVDVGHAAFKTLHTTPSEMLEGLGSRVYALHLHDNDLMHDVHQLPFTMDIDFEAICKSLKKINYQGDITLEADQYLSKMEVTKENLFEYVCNLKAAADKIRDILESL